MLIERMGNRKSAGKGGKETAYVKGIEYIEVPGGL